MRPQGSAGETVCPACNGEKRVRWTDPKSGDVKEKSCPTCHGKGVVPPGAGGKGYATK